jgi:hypothetical protein
MSIEPALLRAAIEGDQPEEVRALLRTASETERSACATALADILKRAVHAAPGPEWETFVRRRGFNSVRDKAAWERLHQLQATVGYLAAALGLARSLRAAEKVLEDFRSADGLISHGLEAVAGVMADREPPWLAEFVQHALEGENWWLGNSLWLMARALVRTGAIERPETPGYTLRFPQAILSAHNRTGSPVALVELLRSDPGLFDDELWRLFTVADVAWAIDQMAWPRYGPRAAKEPGMWTEALATLAAEGDIDRGRLLDACLDAFTQGFAPNSVRWYEELHDRLAPSLTEMADRRDKYLVLLRVNSTPGVTVGQKAVGALLDAGLIEPEAFLRAVPPALRLSQKSLVTKQVRLVEKFLRANQDFKDRALVAGAEAFKHEREDVQREALKLLRRYGLPEGAALAELRDLATALSPALGPEAQQLGLAMPVLPNEDDATKGGLDDLEARVDRLPEEPRAPLRAQVLLAREGKVPIPLKPGPTGGERLPGPLEDPEELVMLFTMLLEDASDTLAVERALAGAVRLALAPELQRRRLVQPLAKRIETRMRDDPAGPFSGKVISSDIAFVAAAWGFGLSISPGFVTYPALWSMPEWVSVDRSGRPTTMDGVLSARAWECTRVINNRRPARLLAEPEFDRGGLSAEQLLERLVLLASSRLPLARYDLELALLRLAPVTDGPFWSEWAHLDAATAATSRRLYEAFAHGPQLVPVFGLPEGRSPLRGHNDWHPHVLARTVGAQTSSSEIWALLTALDDPLADHYKLYGTSFANYRLGPVVAAWPLMCPWQPELAAAHLLRPLSDGLQPGPSPATTAISALTHPGFALGPIGHLALVAGLASAEPDTRIASAEAFTAASVDGRLDPILAGDALSRGVSAGVFKLNRVADALNHASRKAISAYRTVETVCRAAAGLIGCSAPNLHLVFDLAARCAASVGINDVPEAVKELAARKAQSQLVGSAVRLTAVGANRAPDHGAAVFEALEGMVVRAEASEA